MIVYCYVQFPRQTFDFNTDVFYTLFYSDTCVPSLNLSIDPKTLAFYLLHVDLVVRALLPKHWSINEHPLLLYWVESPCIMTLSR